MRLLHTEPLEKVQARLAELGQASFDIGNAHVYMQKAGGDATTEHALSGELYVSSSGWLLLDVPNSLVRGAFQALDENGVELPLKDGRLNAHISVMRPEEIKQIGGIEKITENGKHYHYTLGPIQTVTPAGWKEMSKVWYILVKSKELQELRKSYGLSATPKDNEHEFHITIAVRRKKVLHENDVSKNAASAILNVALGKNVGESLVDDEDADEAAAEMVEVDDSYLPKPAKVPDVRRRSQSGAAKRATAPPAIHAITDPATELEVVTALQRRIKKTNEQEAKDEKKENQRSLIPPGLRRSVDALNKTPAMLPLLGGAGVLGGVMLSNIIKNAGDEHVVHGFDTECNARDRRTADESEEDEMQEEGDCEEGFDCDEETANEIFKYYGEKASEAKPRKRNDRLKSYATAAGAGAAGATGFLLNNLTHSGVPAQVTRFPGRDTVDVVRGEVRPGAPPSTLERSGGGYYYAAHNDIDRAHSHPTTVHQLVDEIKKSLGDKPLEILEIDGHGSPIGQQIGNGTGAAGTITAQNAADIGKVLSVIPRNQDAVNIGYGCNTGLCKPPTRGGDPKLNWPQTFTDNAKVPSIFSRGYTSATNDDTNQLVHATAMGRLPHRAESINNDPGVDRRWSKYTPGKAEPEIIEDKARPDKGGIGYGKETYFKGPNSGLANLLYHVGKPSSLLGSVLTPFIDDKDTAETVAGTASALAAPMAITEILARLGEARGKLDSAGNNASLGTTLTEHGKSQLKALPYLGLAALPLATYAGANLLGRWDKKDKKKDLEDTDERL